MAPGTTDWLSVAVALAAVLALLWLGTQVAARRIASKSGSRRLGLVEAAPLDARRRLVIVRVDGREALMMTGGAQDLFLGWL